MQFASPETGGEQGDRVKDGNAATHRHLLLAESCSSVAGLGKESCGLVLPDVARSTLLIMGEPICVSEISFGDAAVGLCLPSCRSLLDPRPTVAQWWLYC